MWRYVVGEAPLVAQASAAAAQRRGTADRRAGRPSGARLRAAGEAEAQLLLELAGTLAPGEPLRGRHAEAALHQRVTESASTARHAAVGRERKWRTLRSAPLSLCFMARRRVALLVVAALLIGAFGSGAAVGAGTRARAAKGAVKLRTPGGRALPGRWQPWARAALVPTVAGRVTVRRARCPARPSAAGCVYPRRPRTIWVRPGVDDPRGVLLHELGHVYDLLVLNNRDRGHFRRIMHRPRARWWRGRLPLAEQFAEAYSWCARYTRIVSISKYSSYRYRPSAKQHRRTCRLITRAARDGAPPHEPAVLPVVTAPHAPPPPPPSSSQGTVPGDPQHDPGPQKPEDPNKPKPTPTPVLPLPTPTSTPQPLPTPPPLPLFP
jgi:hypothetical protein